MYDEEKKSRYIGSWLNDMKHGIGTMHFASGNIYTGEWRNNVKQGKGNMIWKEKGEEYSGEWEVKT